MRTFTQAKAFALAQHASPRRAGWFRSCQAFSRQCVGAPPFGTSARLAFNATPAPHKHTSSPPPAGSIAYFGRPDRGPVMPSSSSRAATCGPTTSSGTARSIGSSGTCSSAHWHQPYRGWIDRCPAGALPVRIPVTDSPKLTPAFRQAKKVYRSKMRFRQPESDSVWNLQLALMARHLPFAEGPTGFYGCAHPRRACAAFQTAAGLAGDGANGIAGPQTIRRLGLGLGRTAESRARSAPSGSVVACRSMSGEWTISGLDLHVETRRAARRASLEDSLRDAVRDGRLSPGERLPSSRSLAEDLGLSRGTVSAAYDQLVAEGYLVARQGAGTTVATGRPPPYAGRDPALRRTPTFDLRPGTPDVAQFPTAAWLRSARRALNAAHGVGLRLRRPARAGRAAARAGRVPRPDPGSARGPGPDRDHLRVHPVPVSARPGARRRGADRARHGGPGLSFHREVAGGLGRVVPVPVDDHGVRADLLARTWPSVEAVLVTPAHQYPTGVTAASARRHASPTGRGRGRPRHRGRLRRGVPLRPSARRRAPGDGPGDTSPTWARASKTLGPALRLGWMVLPERLVDPVAEAKRFTDLATDAMSQLTLAEMIDSHAYDRQVRAGRVRYRRRRDLLLREVEQIRTKTRRSPVHGVSAGLQALVRLPQDGPAEQDYVERARGEGLAIEGLAQHWQSVAEHHPKGLVVGYGHPSDRAYPAAVAMLGRVLADTLDRSA